MYHRDGLPVRLDAVEDHERLEEHDTLVSGAGLTLCKRIPAQPFIDSAARFREGFAQGRIGLAPQSRQLIERFLQPIHMVY